MTHEEAINIVKTQYPHDSVMKEALGILIPELRESEDERIRKGLINFLRSPFIKENLTDEKVAPWLDWLEKQKEQVTDESDKIAAAYQLGRSDERKQKNWKPREEQMEALNALNCHGDLSYIGQQSQLISLYNDLKKL